MTEREQQIRDMIARRAEAQASDPQQAEAIASPAVDNTQQVEVKTFNKQQETYSTDIVPEVARAIPRGVVESLKNATVNLSRMIGIEGSDKELSPFFTGLLENTQKPKTTVGKIVQDVTAFAASYATLKNLGTAKSAGGMFAQASAKGAAVDFLIWDKDDGRLSDVLSDAGIQNVVVDYLKTDKSDSDFERNLKNALEGAAAGTISEVVFRSVAQGYKLTKAMFTKKGQPIPEGEVIMPSTVKQSTTTEQSAKETAQPSLFNITERQQGESGNDYINRLFTENNVSPEDQKQFFKFSANENFMTDALPKFKKFINSKPYRTEVDYTRGAYQFHGTSGEITTLKDVESSMTETNIYGDGFYTTNKADVASSYTKKGQGTTPSVYKVEEVAPVKNLDLEQTKASDVNVDWEEYGIDSSVSLREAIDELRANTKSYEFMEILDTLRRDFQKQGYGSWSHRGGEQTASQGHFVQIYFNPEKDIKLTKITEEDVAINKEAFNKARQKTTQETPQVVKESKAGVEIPVDTSTVKQGTVPTELTPPESFVNYTKLEGVDEEQIKILEGLVTPEDYARWIETGAKPQSLTKEEAELYAKAVGDDWMEFAVADIKNLKGQDAKLIYYKQVMFGKLKEVSEVVKNFNIDDMDDRLKLTKLYQELAVASGAMKKIQMEAARTTAAGRINIIPRETLEAIEEAVSTGTINPKEFDKIISKATATRIHKELEKVLDINQDVSLHRATLALNKDDGVFTKLVRALVEARTAGILSSPVTQGINIIGNTVVRSVAKVEDTLAWGIGKAFNTKDRLLFDELTATYQGKVTSSLDTLRGLGNAITKSGFDPKRIEDSLEDSYLDNFVKYDTAASKGLSSDYLFNITENSGTIAKGFGTAIDVAGAAVRLPFHALGVTDDMFKRSIYNGQISYIATREANKLGLTGEDKVKYISEFMYAHKLVFVKKTGEFTAEQKPLIQKYIVENQGGFHKEALETARELTFQEEIRTGNGASRLNKALGYLDQIRNLHPAGNIVVPFYVTPVNLLKWVGRRTPLTFAASQRMMDDLKAGGRRRNLAISRLTVGTSLYAAGGFLANEGILIGGSSNYREAEGKKTAGLQEYSIKLGDKTIELNRFDPLVTPLMLGADLAKLQSEMVARGYGDLDGYQEKYDEAMAAVITSVSNNVFNKTWLKSASDLVDAAFRQDAGYFERTIASFAPYSSASRFMQQQETIKEANGIVENLYKIYKPYLLEDALDVFGKPIKDTKIGGLKSTEITDSAVRKEIARLKIPIAKFSNIIEYKNTKLELEPEDHRKLQKYVNSVFKLEDRLNIIVNSPMYKSSNVKDGIYETSKGTRKYLISEAISKAREKATKYYLSKHKEEFLEKYKERIDALQNTNDAIMQKWLERD